MKKITLALVITVLATAFIGTIITSAYTYSLSVELERVRRSFYSESVNISNRFRSLKKELNAEIDGRLDSMDTDRETVADTMPSTEAVTLPVFADPETEPVDTTPALSLYIVSEYEGIIGIFDATGALQTTVNVFVMTLPEADRDALAVGMAVYSLEEALDLAARYE